MFIFEKSVEIKNVIHQISFLFVLCYIQKLQHVWLFQEVLEMVANVVGPRHVSLYIIIEESVPSRLRDHWLVFLLIKVLLMEQNSRSSPAFECGIVRIHPLDTSCHYL